MITNSFYLYSNLIDVYTTVDAINISERFRKVYQRSQKIYRGVDNRLDFQIRNGDQKSIDVTGTTLVFTLLNIETQEQILQKDCYNLDDSSYLRGRVSVTLSEQELRNIERGFYKYTLIQETRSEVDSTAHTVSLKTPMYIDSQYGTFGTIEVYGDIRGEPVESITVSAFTEIYRESSTEQQTYRSSIINARPEISNPYSLHTFAFYSTSYSGEITIEGSQSEGADPKVWATLENISPTSAIEYINITGKYNWFRITHEPQAGTLDKVVYRN